MSTLKVDQITDRLGTGAPVITNGAVVSAGYAVTCAGGVNITGVVTATSFVGSGANLTNLTVVTPSNAVAFKRILKFDEFRT